MGETMRILIQTTVKAQTLFNLFHFYLDMDVVILILIRGIAALLFILSLDRASQVVMISSTFLCTTSAYDFT